MASHQTIKLIQIQNRDKFIYHLTYWIAVVLYEEIDDDQNDPDIPETESNDYNTGYDEDADL